MHHKYNEYNPEFTLYYTSTQRKHIQGRSPSFKCATGEQSLSGVSRTMNDHSEQNNLQHETLQPRMVNTLNVLASRTNEHKGSINYMHIWLGGVQAHFLKAI